MIKLRWFTGLQGVLLGIAIALLWFWQFPADRALDMLSALVSSWHRVQASFVVGDTNWLILLLPTILIGAVLFSFKEVFPTPTWVSRALISALLISLGIRYQLWRFFSTLNLSDPINGFLSSLLFVMEFITFINSVGYLLQTIPSTNRSAEATELSLAVLRGQYRPWVDVLIPTYNEPAEILERTIIGCQAMDYAYKRIYLLDDLRRPAIRQLAADLGCIYVDRPDNRHAKAGNLNHALPLITGELIAVFDADFIPTRDFLTRTVGFFQDRNVALLQTPQNFYNEDPIGANLGLQDILTNEQALFFRHIQPSRDATNSVVCCGTCFVIRRQALDEIGGIPTESITEDFFTSLNLQARGYRIKYLNEGLSAGMAPESIGAYITQRLRWGQGTIQTLFCSLNVFTLPGLSWLQRASHALGILYWFLCFSRIVFLVMPLAYLWFDLAPLRATVDQVLVFFVPYYVCNILVLSWLTAGRRSALWSDVYETILCFPLALTVLRTLRQPFGRGFSVTPKGITGRQIQVNWALMSPLVVLLTLSILGLGMRLVTTPWSTGNPDSLIINMVWTGYNLVLLQICMLIAVDVPQRKYPRFQHPIPCEIWVGEGWLSGQIVNLSEGGLAAIFPNLPNPLPRSRRIQCRILSLGLTLEARVRHQKNLSTGEEQLAIQFTDLPLAAKRVLIAFLYTQPGMWRDQQMLEHTTVWALVRSVFHWYSLAVTR
jgi:cellulose synthase (UDP-forming)